MGRISYFDTLRDLMGKYMGGVQCQADDCNEQIEPGTVQSGRKVLLLNLVLLPEDGVLAVVLALLYCPTHREYSESFKLHLMEWTDEINELRLEKQSADTGSSSTPYLPMTDSSDETSTIDSDQISSSSQSFRTPPSGPEPAHQHASTPRDLRQMTESPTNTSPTQALLRRRNAPRRRFQEASSPPDGRFGSANEVDAACNSSSRRRSAPSTVSSAERAVPTKDGETQDETFTIPDSESDQSDDDHEGQGLVPKRRMFASEIQRDIVKLARMPMAPRRSNPRTGEIELGYVYALQHTNYWSAKKGPLTKIGSSDRPEGRIGKLEDECTEIKLTLVSDTDRDGIVRYQRAEHLVHKLLRDFHVQLQCRCGKTTHTGFRTEYFARLPPDLIQVAIDTMTNLAGVAYEEDGSLITYWDRALLNIPAAPKGEDIRRRIDRWSKWVNDTIQRQNNLTPCGNSVGSASVPSSSTQTPWASPMHWNSSPSTTGSSIQTTPASVYALNSPVAMGTTFRDREGSETAPSYVEQPSTGWTYTVQSVICAAHVFFGMWKVLLVFAILNVYHVSQLGPMWPWLPEVLFKARSKVGPSLLAAAAMFRLDGKTI